MINTPDVKKKNLSARSEMTSATLLTLISLKIHVKVHVDPVCQYIHLHYINVSPYYPSSSFLLFL